MKIGMNLPVMVPGLDRDTILEWARRIDAGPYSSLAAGERIAFPNPEIMVTMSAAAGRVGSGTTQLARAFTGAFGIPPHRYVIGRRLDAARDRILRGQPLAEVAAEVGFVDQAHLTRRFRQFLGTTPGRFGRS